MNGPMKKLTISLIILIVCGLFAFSQRPQRSDALRQIIPGHYLFTSSTYNSGVIATSEGVIVLDALNSEAVGRAERKAIEDTIRQPVRVLVSSSFHIFEGQPGLRACVEDRPRKLSCRSPRFNAKGEGAGRGAEIETSESDLS